MIWTAATKDYIARQIREPQPQLLALAYAFLLTVEMTALHHMTPFSCQIGQNGLNARLAAINFKALGKEAKTA